jgi:hypothetical protein
MKTFIDRFSDLLALHKDLGRSLRGKSVYLISSGSDIYLPKCLEEQFKLICEYLGMKYAGVHYCSFSETNTMLEPQIQDAKAFGNSIFEK